MDEVTLSDYRCFHSEQQVRLAPLTILVGENSTGKTSFLAMVRALWEVAYQDAIPDFKAPPYDLGSFDEVAHHRGKRGGRTETFDAGFRATEDSHNDQDPICFDVTFARLGSAPVPVRRRVSRGMVSVEATQTGDMFEVTFETANGSWRTERRIPLGSGDSLLTPMLVAEHDLHDIRRECKIADGDMADILSLVHLPHRSAGQPYAGAPVRSKPRRTYDPARPVRDPEGDYVPMYWADVFFRDRQTWNDLKERIEAFGKAAGLFDEVSVRSLGAKASEPFRLEVRRFGSRLKGPPRNLIDVGYGVSQVLPVLTELLRPDAAPILLLQQPEVHLHPRAQAALATLLCATADRHRRLIVETHSDYLIDRVRTEVRDGTAGAGIQPEDVSILYFERTELDVTIHSMSVDANGNVVGAPDSYGKFFMEETRRSIGL